MKKNVRYTSLVLASLFVAGIGFTQVQPVKADVNYQKESNLDNSQDQNEYEKIPSVSDVLQGAKNIDEKVDRTQKMIDYLQSEIVDNQGYQKEYQAQTDGINADLAALKKQSPEQYEQYAKELKPSLDFNQSVIKKFSNAIAQESSKIAEFKAELDNLNKAKEEQNEKQTPAPSSSDNQGQNIQPIYQQPEVIKSEPSTSNPATKNMSDEEKKYKWRNSY